MEIAALTRRSRLFGLAGLVAVGWVAGMLGGCSFNSSLEGARCSDAGATRGDKVCRNGFWVSVGADGGVVDTDGGSCTGGNERCGDGADNDCDGVVDEGCPCTGWSSKSQGVCSGDGIRTDEGKCGPPPAYVEEEGGTSGAGCGDVKDNDCDGETDEDCGCNYNGKGAGVCTNQPKDNEGKCKKPKSYQAPTDSENCDQKDNDCDSHVDEGCGCTYDGDGDGDPSNDSGVCEGQSRDAKGNCQEPSDYISPTDDESKAGSKSEYCDGKDSDCDGVTDEGCPCVFDGNNNGKSTDDSGVCLNQTIQPDGTCKKPKDYTSESDESKAGSNFEFCDQLDNNCDGNSDEGCPCKPVGKTRSCGQSEGECKEGTQKCESDGWSNCNGSVGPKQEDCDGKDDDCDGSTDENLTQACSKQDGVCGGSRIACQGGSYPTCGSSEYGNAYESGNESSCDNRDNDCDGNTDEGISKNCSKQQGVCSGATRSCSGGSFPTCDQNQYGNNYESGGEQSCDGHDNDCDGNTDENLSQNCSKQQGVCSGATVSCQNGSYPSCGSNEYGGDYESGNESSCDNKDNDCDGNTDENITKNCSKQQGVCSGDTKSCSSGSFPNNCDSSQYGNDYESTESSCGDGKDNDCDGDTDCEDSDCSGQQCNGSGTSCIPGDSDCHETDCGDGNNNDGDNYTDCGDPDCHARSGSCNQRIFVTSSSYSVGSSGSSSFDSLSQAHTLCQNAASSAGLSGTWKAVISDQSNDADGDVVSVNGVVHNLNGEKVADDSSDMWDGNIDNAVNYDENGSQVSSGTKIWTGTHDDGDRDGNDTCAGWSSNGSGEDSETGISSSSNSDWIDRGSDGGSEPMDLHCDDTAPLYCIDGQ